VGAGIGAVVPAGATESVAGATLVDEDDDVGVSFCCSSTSSGLLPGEHATSTETVATQLATTARLDIPARLEGVVSAQTTTSVVRCGDAFVTRICWHLSAGMCLAAGIC
jgi:hypothetical protein